MSEGEAARLGWVTAHPARARRRVRAARVFMSPKAAGCPDLLVIWGEGAKRTIECRAGEWILRVIDFGVLETVKTKSPPSDIES